MKTLLDFLKSSTGELSSKRLAFIFCQPFIIIGFLGAGSFLLERGQYILVLDLWNSFLFYSAALGGLVTSELFKPTRKK